MPNITRDQPPDKSARITFHVVLTPEPGCDDPTRALKRGLKCLERRFGLRATSSTEVT